MLLSIVQNSASLVRKIVGDENFEKCKELSGYLEDSFGNAQRVDYGTGHETTFFVFLCCLYKALVLQRSELPATILLVFPAYLKVCRHLQTVYWLEPAGSHGVWCLDDYQLLPFVFGSAQLIGGLSKTRWTVGNPSIAPKSVLDKEIVDANSTDYMYLEAIKFIGIVGPRRAPNCRPKRGH